MSREPIFRDVELGAPEREALDRDGHVAFPGLLTDHACRRLACSLDYIDSIRAHDSPGHEPSRFAAEYDWYLESLIGHPQLLGMARAILGQGGSLRPLRDAQSCRRQRRHHLAHARLRRR